MSTAVTISSGSASLAGGNARLVARVNALYHQLTRDTFDATHRARHAVERPFWEGVGRSVLALPAGGPRTVVDLACGTGFVSQILRTYLRPGDQLLDIDLNAAALLTIARQHGNPQLACLTGSGESIPLAGGCVDLLALNAALHHFPRPLHALAEIDRILRPGGWFALGFEPNRTHFTSEVLPTAATCLARAAWYASPRENARRLRQRLGLLGLVSEEARVCAEISAALCKERLTDRPLSPREILDLVDPHARGHDELGFDPLDLIGRAFPSYRVEQLFSSDYLGEIPRRAPIFRQMVDRALRAVLPNHGSLFCWLLQKPADGEGGAC